ncbi:MAG: heavy-metal-associated domain-containing protein [Acidobacteria bacterium]|nr:heavy-metal-associated domain-containing protein [Acidobacteriota bacterium]MDW7983102.1 cation transporter [Acidobacteriota bacterium]
MQKGITLLVALLLIGGTALAAVKAYSLTFKGMHCKKCATNIQKALNKIEGVSDVQVNWENKVVRLKLDDSKTSLDEVKRVLADSGYEVKEAKEVRE